MTEQNEVEPQINVEFEALSTDQMIYKTVVLGLHPELNVRAELDEDTNEVTLHINVYGLEVPSEIIETTIEVLQNLLPKVKEQEAAGELDDAEPRQD